MLTKFVPDHIVVVGRAAGVAAIDCAVQAAPCPCMMLQPMKEAIEGCK